LFIDIDNFRNTTPVYVHATGDNSAQQVGREVLANQVADKGLVARYGGEEVCHFAARTLGTSMIARRSYAKT